MRAVWRAARAAVHRRRLQTTIIGVVVFCSTTAIVVALGLLDASSAPFDRSFAQQRGAHIVATFDPAQVSAGQLTRTARHPGVQAVAGPFAQAVIDLPQPTGPGPNAGPLTVVGRADPAGPVDRLTVGAGHWATENGQIVLNAPAAAAPNLIGRAIEVRGLPRLVIVGLASSITGSADAWVSPGQITALHPDALQMLYRFSHSATDRQLHAELATATAGTPRSALVAAQSYLTAKQDVDALASAYVPFLILFGSLGLVVAVVIVANVISGAVIAGFRHIGVLKSLGFTSLQVVGVYLTMVGVPTIVGCVIGTGLGALATRPLLEKIFTVRQSAVLAGGVSVRPWVNVATLLGVPAIVVLAAVIPALRAQRLSAAEAISAGSAPRAGRGLRLQRWLTGARLPRSVSLGLGLLAGRPSRTALTAATILLGVTTVTFASGLSSTMVRYGSGIERAGAVQVEVQTGSSRSPRTDAERESLLRSVPGSVHVTAEMFASVHLAGYSQSVTTTFLRGDSATLGHVLVKGRWLSGPGEVVVPPGFLNQHDLAVGDHVTLQSAGHQVRATVVGETFAGDPNSMFADWRTDSQLDLPGRASNYEVQVAHGTDIAAYIRAVHAADPGLTAAAKTTVNTGAVTLIGSASLLTVMLAVVAALGVFNTVVLNTRERRRDLGMLKSIGMTPRQVIVMMMASMATLGVIGGLLGVPIGVIAHRLIVPRMVGPAGIVLPPAMMDVWHLPTLALLAVAGVAIAVVGAAIPARSAARLAIAEVLRNE